MQFSTSACAEDPKKKASQNSEKLFFLVVVGDPDLHSILSSKFNNQRCMTTGSPIIIRDSLFDINFSNVEHRISNAQRRLATGSLSIDY